MLLTVHVNGMQYSRNGQSVDAAFTIADQAEFRAEQSGEPLPLIEVTEDDNGGVVFWSNRREAAGKEDPG